MCDGAGHHQRRRQKLAHHRAVPPLCAPGPQGRAVQGAEHEQQRARGGRPAGLGRRDRQRAVLPGTGRPRRAGRAPVGRLILESKQLVVWLAHVQRNVEMCFRCEVYHGGGCPYRGIDAPTPQTKKSALAVAKGACGARGAAIRLRRLTWRRPGPRPPASWRRHRSKRSAPAWARGPTCRSHRP